MKVKRHCPKCGFPFIYMNDACYCTDALGNDMKKLKEKKLDFEPFELNSDCHKSSGWKRETCREFINFLNEYADIHLKEQETTLICSDNAMAFVEMLPTFEWSPIKSSGLSIPDYVGYIQFINKKIKFVKDSKLENILIKTQNGDIIARNE